MAIILFIKRSLAFCIMLTEGWSEQSRGGNLKRFLFCVSLLLGGSALADVGVNWEQDSNLVHHVYKSDQTTPLPVGSVIQLIWTPVASINPINPMDPLVPSGAGEVVLTNSVANAAPGTILYMGLQFADTYTNGYVYTRVFDALSQSAVRLTTYYAQGGLSALLSKLPTIPLPTDWVYSCIASDSNVVLTNTVGSGCDFTLSPSYAIYNSSPATGQVTIIATGTNCAWEIRNSNDWITILSSTSGVGSSNFIFGVASNSTGLRRQGNITLADLYTTVIQLPAGGGCEYAISPTSVAASASGGTGLVSIYTATGCSWTVENTNAWIQDLSPLSGTNNGYYSYYVMTNEAGARVATVTVAGLAFVINQTAAECTYSIDPSFARVTARGSDGQIQVSAGSWCSWTATNNVEWIVINSGSSGTGSGVVDYTVWANDSVTGRTGTVAVAEQTFIVIQSGVGSLGQPWMLLLMD